MNDNNRPEPSSNFIREIINEDLRQGKHDGRVVTRFPPEPNGYLHIGHAKSICLNFGIARDYAGATCALRFDDTNPVKESLIYVEAIKRDVRWLGFDWGERAFHTSDYFERLFQYALELVEKGRAYVCSLDSDQTRAYRGTLTEAGRDSPDRNRTVADNLDLFTRMRAGEFEDGALVLRAKIDMASPNLNLRDPVIYRIRRASHQMTGDRWCIYPMYDFAHCLSDAIEGVTHSLCTLEFEDHRALYDWYLDQLDLACHPQQIEFSRLNLNYTVMSKRKLNELVTSELVGGWDDPRLPTLAGMRRRGYTPAAIRDFCDRVGVTRKDGIVEMGVLENSVREDLDRCAKRVMGVLRPLKLVIENYPVGQVEQLEAKNHPQNPQMGERSLPFGRELYIEQDDFEIDPPKKYFRLTPGREVRLRYGYLVTCTGFTRDPVSGEVTEVRCTYDPETKGGNAPDGRKVKGTIHWVSAAHAVRAEVRLYDRLFNEPNPGASGADYRQSLNPDSLTLLSGCQLEPGLADATLEQRYQFERLGYFCLDVESAEGRLVFNRTVTLRDS
ncbi:MAG: glutamine--tRNA ligase/YqeY domain fusion protein, partial [Gammaproteobacteria bacterium]|nr:glutamine--tRNA ligase/YqeY domain fusion protein [Gammaproteobacteria bacterium]